MLQTSATSASNGKTLLEPKTQSDFLPPMTLVGARLLDMITADQLFKVTAADWNGKEFDGAPIVPMFKKSAGLAWLKDAKLQVGNPGCTDYASWCVTDPETGRETWAGPGDYLFRVDPNKAHIVVIPGVFLQPLIGD